MEVSILQMCGVVLFSAVIIYDHMNTLLLTAGGKVIAGLGTGLILGDPVTGLAVGAVLELMSMGIGAFGGASIPDYYLGAIIGTSVAVMSGQGADFGVLIGVPLSVLAIQLDVIVRTVTAFYVHRAKASANRGNVLAAYRWLWSGYTFWLLKYVLPVVTLFIIGSDALTAFVNAVPQGLVSGFSVVGGLLPVVGIAMLLRVMNFRAQLPFLILGFALASYLKLPMIGIGVFGAAAAILVYRSSSRRLAADAARPGEAPADNAMVLGGHEDEL